MSVIINFITGLSWSSLALVIIGIYFIAKKGIPWTFSEGAEIAARIAGWWSVGVADLKAVQTAIANDVAVLKNDVEVIKSQLGIKPAQPTPPPPAAS